jgi:hypothetical protein
MLPFLIAYASDVINEIRVGQEKLVRRIRQQKENEEPRITLDSTTDTTILAPKESLNPRLPESPFTSHRDQRIFGERNRRC